MRYLLLFFTLVLQFDVSSYNAHNPITVHAPKIPTSENIPPHYVRGTGGYKSLWQTGMMRSRFSIYLK